MKKTILSKGITTVCLCLGLMTISTASQAQRTQEKPRKYYLSPSFLWFKLGADTFTGGGFAFGFMPSPENLFAIEFGGGGVKSSQIGNFAYTLISTGINKYDGVISYGYTMFESMLMWNRIFDLSEKWKFRLGPAIGMQSITGRDYYQPSNIKGLPTQQSKTEYALMVGAVAGFRWNFAERWFLDTSYRLSGNTSLEFPQRDITIAGHNAKLEGKKFGNVGNRIALTAGLRF